MTDLEFSRLVRLDTLGTAPRRWSIAAEPAECAALAERFGLIAIEKLVAETEVWRDAVGPQATITLTANVVQACIATGDPVQAGIAASARLRFLPTGAVEGEEIELDADECDTIFYEGGTIDLGEAAAETMALEIDPFPRSKDAEAALRAAGVVGESEVENAAFSGLKALRDRLERDE